MLLNLILDGNYILSKLTFTLHKNNILYGALHQALENSISSYRKWYPFKNIYLVSDSKEKSWRKQLLNEYKTTRKKDNNIDWNFVYNTYTEFKQSIAGVKILEHPGIEGDDWISYVSKMSNDSGISTIIVSNDYDIKQLVNYSLDPLYINIMTNEMYNKEKLFLPKNYQIFISKVRNLPNDDIFSLNDNSEFLRLFDKFLNKYDIKEVDHMESLIVKLISGDKSDNITSAWSQVKNGKKRGIGQKGAKTIYDKYISEFGEININDPDLYENIADLICEKKKVSKSQIDSIIDNIKSNSKIIDLDVSKIPSKILNIMSELYDEKQKLKLF